MTKTTNTNPTDYIAIDVSKATLQIQDDQRTFAVDNDSEGHSKLRKHIKTRQNPLVVFEATGGYERGLCEFLRKEAIPLTMVNPARVRDFARSEGVRAKTDPIDTKMILAFPKSKALCAMETPSETCTKLAALLDRRGTSSSNSPARKTASRTAKSSSLAPSSEGTVQQIGTPSEVRQAPVNAFVSEFLGLSEPSNTEDTLKIS